MLNIGWLYCKSILCSNLQKKLNLFRHIVVVVVYFCSTQCIKINEIFHRMQAKIYDKNLFFL